MSGECGERLVNKLLHYVPFLEWAKDYYISSPDEITKIALLITIISSEGERLSPETLERCDKFCSNLYSKFGREYELKLKTGNYSNNDKEKDKNGNFETSRKPYENESFSQPFALKAFPNQRSGSDLHHNLAVSRDIYERSHKAGHSSRPLRTEPVDIPISPLLSFPKRESRFDKYIGGLSSMDVGRTYEERLDNNSQPMIEDHWNSRPAWESQSRFPSSTGPSSGRQGTRWDSPNSQHFPSSWSQGNSRERHHAPQSYQNGEPSMFPNTRMDHQSLRHEPKNWSGHHFYRNSSNTEPKIGKYSHKGQYEKPSLQSASEFPVPNLPAPSSTRVPRTTDQAKGNQKVHNTETYVRKETPKEPSNSSETENASGSSSARPNEFVSPLNNLYGGTWNSNQSGRGYGVQSNKIPKKKTLINQCKAVTKPTLPLETDASTVISSSPEKNTISTTVASSDRQDTTQTLGKKKGKDPCSVPLEVARLREDVTDFMKGTTELGSRRSRSKSSQPAVDEASTAKGGRKRKRATNEEDLTAYTIATPYGEGNETVDDTGSHLSSVESNNAMDEELEESKKQIESDFEDDNTVSGSCSRSNEETTDRESSEREEGLLGRQLYICGNIGCLETAETISDFKDHLMVCDKTRDSLLLTCRHCEKSVKQLHNFIEHLQTHGVKRFLCGICSFRANLVSKVKRHMKTLHRVNVVDKVPVQSGPRPVHVENTPIAFYPRDRVASPKLRSKTSGKKRL